jgi:hypothetical protein
MTGIGEARIRGPLFLVFLLLAGCDDAPGEWAAIVYPDRADRTRFDVTPRFKTFSYCRDQAIVRMKAIQIKSGGDYECGFQCELSGDPHRMNVCRRFASRPSRIWARRLSRAGNLWPPHRNDTDHKRAR